MIRLKSVHAPSGEGDGPRYLIDWKWPARRHHPELRLTGWPRKLLPDAGLWNWFHHDPGARLQAFRARYFHALNAEEKTWAPIARAAEKGAATLLYDPRSVRVAPAPFLKEYLEAKSRMHRIPKRGRKKLESQSGYQTAVPVEKAVSRKRARPPREEMSFKPKQKMTFVSAGRRRMPR